MRILVLPYTHQIGSTHLLINQARYLRDEGHEVVVAGDGPYLEMAKQHNLKTDFLEEIPIELYRSKTDQGELDYYTEEEIEEMIEKEISLYQKYDMEAVISTLRFTANLSAEKYNIPNVSITYSVLTNYYGLSINIPETHDLYKYRNIPPLFYTMNKLSGPIKKHIFKKFAKPYNNVAIRNGLSTYENFASLYEGDYTLLYDVPEFAPVKSQPDKMFYIGDIFNDISQEIPRWYDEVVEKKKKEKKSVIYLSMGSSGTLFPKILDDLVNYIQENELILIASSCNHEYQSVYSERKDVYLTQFASAKKMLELSDLVVQHGGRGTMFDSIKMALPMIFIPHQAEQEWNARRAAELGLGIMVSKTHYESTDLYKAIEEIFRKYDVYKNSSQAMKENFDKVNWKEVLDFVIADIYRNKHT